MFQPNVSFLTEISLSVTPLFEKKGLHKFQNALGLSRERLIALLKSFCLASLFSFIT